MPTPPDRSFIRLRGHTGRTMLLPVLVGVFIVLPLAELAIILLAGRELGVWPTIGLLVLSSVLGAWLARREGAHAWRRFRAALGQGRVPSTEIADGALVLLAGALLATPGFL